MMRRVADADPTIDPDALTRRVVDAQQVDGGLAEVLMVRARPEPLGVDDVQRVAMGSELGQP
ncbi:hypothetical protein BH24ACT15_BH24ACT15_05790 [soil metagenome]